MPRFGFRQQVSASVVEDASRPRQRPADEEIHWLLGAKRLTTSGWNRHTPSRCAPHPQAVSLLTAMKVYLDNVIVSGMVRSDLQPMEMAAVEGLLDYARRGPDTDRDLT